LTPKKWISQLKTGQKMSKKQSSKRAESQKIFYTEEFKQRIVEEVLSGKLNKTQAQNMYGIRGNATILYWVRQYEGLNPHLRKPENKPLANFADMKQNIADKKLIDELKETKELLRVAELRADLWQRAVEIAEEKFDIDIIKKFGAQALHQLKNKDQKKK
jgi:transposase-like protein